MNTNTPETKSSDETLVLAGRNEGGPWQMIDSAAPEEGETVEDVRDFLVTMSHASSRNFRELEIVTTAEFARRCAADPPLAA
jgi:hypothetical protein